MNDFVVQNVFFNIIIPHLECRSVKLNQSP